ncbi:hypothetical protein LSH36_147g09021 [Paralvinella palmiformis]|uniref:Uncharacterized protein n=1 Tax=Paralvinella palmiformis TaxID=53620 RepID=A0AAD9JVT4_9ANNE|nr:hypothetical protein LSH36_147g09021 [Paralvinella palmiformis]
MLTRDAVCRLLVLVDKAIEAKTPEHNIIDPEEIKKSWRVGKVIKIMRTKCDDWQMSKMKEEQSIVPKNIVQRTILRICSHPAFDIVISMLHPCDNLADSPVYLNPALLKIVKAMRVLRLLRSLRLFKGLLPHLMTLIDRHINKKIRLGYDVGIGYLRGEEEVLYNINLMTTRASIIRELRLKCATGRLKIMKELGR